MSKDRVTGKKAASAAGKTFASGKSTEAAKTPRRRLTQRSSRGRK